MPSLGGQPGLLPRAVVHADLDRGDAAVLAPRRRRRPATGPALTWASGPGTSIRDSVLIGACAAQPRWVQYAVAAREGGHLSSVTHLVADT